MAAARLPLIVMTLILALAAGCSAPPEPTAPSVLRVSAQDPQSYDALFTTAGDVLRKYYFRLDRQDRVSGVITTHPETTANWFEFWRPQPENAYQWAEANSKTMQRQAKLVLEQTQEAGAYDVTLVIERLQYSLPERQIDNSAGAMRLFSDIAPTYGGRLEKPSTTGYWIPAGRDEMMEISVLNDISERYAVRAFSTTQPSIETR